jgi:hypothetical protein
VLEAKGLVEPRQYGVDEALERVGALDAPGQILHGLHREHGLWFGRARRFDVAPSALLLGDSINR